MLLTGMSGTGKSSLVRELRRRGFSAHDADDDGFAEPDAAGAWHWRTDKVAELFASSGEDPLFFAGCSDEQAQFQWDLYVLLTAPEEVIVERLETRTTNAFGKSAEERERVLADLRDIEPMLRRSADVVIDTNKALADVTEALLAVLASRSAPERGAR